MQDADDLDKAGFDGAVEDHVHRIADRRLAALVAAMADMQATQPGEEVAPVQGRQPLRIGRDPPQCRRQQPAISDARLGAVHRLAGAQH